MRFCLPVVRTLAVTLLSLGGMTWGGGALAAAPEPLALGLIVKLKDSAQPTSVVKLQASALPRESAQRVRSRLAAAAQRKHVSYLVQRPTAFAAQVLHSGHPVPLAEARAQAERLRSDPDVEWVVVNQIERPAAVAPVAVSQPPTDPWYAEQIWLQGRTTNEVGAPRSVPLPGLANIPAAWSRINGLSSITPVVTAVLDTGVLYPSDLGGRVLPGYDFVSELEYSRDGNGLDPDPSDPGDWLTQPEKDANPQLYADPCKAANSSWHGLSVSYMLAATTNNPVDGAGILAPLSGAVVLPVRVAGICGAALSDIIEGMLWAAGVSYQGTPAANPTPARVINLSFGGSGDCSNTTVQSGDWLYRQTIATLRQKGVLLVASAGNGDGTVGSVAPTRPASCPGVLAVTALRQDASKAGYANQLNGTRTADGYYGVAVFAGDVNQPVVTMSNSGTMGPSLFMKDDRAAGTSFAAPTAAGVAALMLAVSPGMTVDELLQALTMTASTFPAPTGGLPVCSAVNLGHCACTNTTCGSGVLDADQAVAAAVTHAASSPGYVSADASASYFTPDRLHTADRSATKAGGGGGGAMDDVALCGLLGALVWTWARRSRGGVVQR